jgi:hypothetical protein
MPSTRLASTSSESSRRNGFLSGLDESGGESSAVAAASVVAMAIEGIRDDGDDDDDDNGRLKANLDSAPLGTSYSGGSIDRLDDDHQTITSKLNPAIPPHFQPPCSLPACLGYLTQPTMMHITKGIVHVKYNSKLKILGLTSICKASSPLTLILQNDLGRSDRRAATPLSLPQKLQVNSCRNQAVAKMSLAPAMKLYRVFLVQTSTPASKHPPKT